MPTAHAETARPDGDPRGFDWSHPLVLAALDRYVAGMAAVVRGEMSYGDALRAAVNPQRRPLPRT